MKKIMIQYCISIAVVISLLFVSACKKHDEKVNVNPPTLSILEPIDGSTFTEGQIIKIEAYAYDYENCMKAIYISINDDICSISAYGDGVLNTEKYHSLIWYTDSNYIGNVKISVEAVNLSEVSSFKEINITINDAYGVPNAIFCVNATYSYPNRSITFHNMSYNAPTSWSWNFGDGNTSSIQNPTHSYSNIGKYSVSLKVSNAFGVDSTTYTDYVKIIER